jgi:hypothetical protein
MTTKPVSEPEVDAIKTGAAALKNALDAGTVKRTVPAAIEFLTAYFKKLGASDARAEELARLIMEQVGEEGLKSA